MKSIIKSVIASKNYDLKDMIKKINANWVQGNLTEAEKDELISDAQDGAQISNSVDILAKIRELDMRIKTLEDAAADKEPTDEAEYPEYVAGKWYYSGDKIHFAGDNYTCIAPDGVVCVWSPDEYPAYWDIETVTAEPPLEGEV